MLNNAPHLLSSVRDGDVVDVRMGDKDMKSEPLMKITAESESRMASLFRWHS